MEEQDMNAVERDLKNHLADFRNVIDFLNSKQGESFLNELKRFCYADKTTFDPQEDSTNGILLREGRRQVYLYFSQMKDQSFETYQRQKLNELEDWKQQMQNRGDSL